jgi:hypothetical protein
MPVDVPDPAFDPKWLWATRVTAEAARAAMVQGRTPQERFEIYERLILAACEERQRRRNPKPSTSIAAEATASLAADLFYNYIEVEDSNIISAFDEAEPGDPSL